MSIKCSIRSCCLRGTQLQNSVVIQHAASQHAVVLRSDHSPPHPLSTTVRRWRGAQHEVAATQSRAHPPRPALLLLLLLLLVLLAPASPLRHLVPLLLQVWWLLPLPSLLALS